MTDSEPQDKLERECPTCGAGPGERCITISGNTTNQPHLGRWLPPGSYRERHIYAPYRRQR